MKTLSDRLRAEAVWVGSTMIAPRTRKRLEQIADEIDELIVKYEAALDRERILEAEKQ